ncbi:hypothetical protein RJ640_008428 [Escallonia rubra]|uniref:Ubiquitin-like protein ATG12 n=1 Tax=Escallonia rubra TaxID=112253 RepID=A0AA88UM46_9ASTE|nr:hypothetical protein RJ640_008428 [Escallonia rubra]
MASDSPHASRKVVVHLRATGDAPILKQAKFKIAGTDKFAKVIDFLRRQLHRETLFVYVNSAFSPNPDELVVDLYNRYSMGVSPPERPLTQAVCDPFSVAGRSALGPLADPVFKTSWYGVTMDLTELFSGSKRFTQTRKGF